MPPGVRGPTEELDDLASRSTATFKDALSRLSRSIVLADREDHEAALAALANLAAETMTLADLFGRRRLLLEVEHSPGSEGHGMLLAETPIVPSVPFKEAVEDLARRYPMLAEEIALPGEPAWRAVARIYASDANAFAIARSADLVLTGKVQDAILGAMRRGEPKPKTLQLLRDLGDFTDAYAETVYRTNLNSAYNAGRFRQAQGDTAAKVIGGFRYNAIMDSDVRPNHAAAHGLIASQFDPVWEHFSPPLGYNCRCSLTFLDRFEAERLGLIENGHLVRREPPNFEDAHPDEGFEKRGRPDRKIYS